MYLDDKVAIVTGAGRGIGRGIAQVFVAQGARVALVARSKDELEGVRDEILQAGGDAEVFPADLTSPDDVKSMVCAVLDHFGKIDVLVNNAGGGTVQATVTQLTEEEWDSGIAANLTSVFLCCKYVLPAMIAAGGGSIVNISSTRGVSGRRNATPYAPAKAAVIHLTKCMALDYSDDNIRVNCVCPGAIATETTADTVRQLRMLQNKEVITDPARARRLASLQSDPTTVKSLIGANAPLGRQGTPEEVGYLVSLLASDQAAYITGAIVPVDGGRLAGG